MADDYNFIPPQVNQDVTDYATALTKDNGWDRFRKAAGSALIRRGTPGGILLGALIGAANSPSDVAQGKLAADQIRAKLGDQYGQQADVGSIVTDRRQRGQAFTEDRAREKQLQPFQNSATIGAMFGEQGLESARESGVPVARAPEVSGFSGPAPTPRFNPETKRFELDAQPRTEPNYTGRLTDALLVPVQKPTALDVQESRNRGMTDRAQIMAKAQADRAQATGQVNKIVPGVGLVNAQTGQVVAQEPTKGIDYSDITKEEAASMQALMDQGKTPDNAYKQVKIAAAGKAKPAAAGQVDGGATLTDEQAAAYLAARRGGMSKEEAYKQATGQ